MFFRFEYSESRFVESLVSVMEKRIRYLADLLFGVLKNWAFGIEAGGWGGF